MPSRVAAVTDAFLSSLRQLCFALMESMSTEQQNAWTGYLDDYTAVIAGCRNLVQPPPGGINVFGLANVAAVGGERGSLSEDDADLLIRLFVPPFLESFHLDGAARLDVTAHLRRVAELEVDRTLIGLAVCAQGREDAGP